MNLPYSYTTTKRLCNFSSFFLLLSFFLYSRLVHRPVDDSTLAEIIGKIEQEKAKQARLAQKAQQAEQSEAAMLSASKESQHSSSVDEAAITSDTKAHMQERISEEKMDVQEELVEKMGEKTAQEDCRKEMSTFQTEPMDAQDVTGQASQFSESREGGASSASARLSNVDSAQSGAVGVSAIERLRQMNIPGVEIITPNDFYDLSPEQQQVWCTFLFDSCSSSGGTDL